MTCRETVAALVECARRGEAPDAALRSHLTECEPCQSRWRCERDLTVHFGAMTALAEASEARSRARRDARAAALIAGFGNPQPRLELVKPARKASWGWMLSAAAALLLVMAAGYGVGTRARRKAPVPAIRTHGVKAASSVIYEVSADADAMTGDSATGEAGFIAVPFALPLAAGEIVRVVHSEFYPQALASMGIDVNPEWVSGDSGDIAADVVVGQDGFPRAVRIADTTDF